MIQFAKEPLTDALWDEAMPLLHAHWKEVAHFQDIPLEPDRDVRGVYASSERAGILRVFTAREPLKIRTSLPVWQFLAFNENTGIDRKEIGGRLVGYALYFVRTNPHYASSLQAAQDVIYLDPTARGKTGYKFIAWCDEQLASEGVQVVRHHVKAAHDFGKLLQRQGYEVEDIIYVKRLDSHVSPSKDLSTPEMGQDWRDQAQHDYDTARFVGTKP